MVLELNTLALAGDIGREELGRKLVMGAAQHGHYMGAEVLDNSLDRRPCWQCCCDGVVALQKAVWYGNDMKELGVDSAQKGYAAVRLSEIPEPTAM